MRERSSSVEHWYVNVNGVRLRYTPIVLQGFPECSYAWKDRLTESPQTDHTGSSTRSFRR